MVIECLECKHKNGLPFSLVFHWSICHKDKIIKCAGGDKSLSGICIKELAPPMKTDRSFSTRNGSSVNPNPNPN